ncbi:hypothetical protein FHR32_008575 [Streptosporangium album]|uniref:DUF35 domain-containing protein n=1 Tax=Streptosporangium album TaxID=47479 RepID=A0A7W7WDY5_9ACTN|nr:OB-fold domain-containing protein [Streptosporangium album]MBB4944172.1 hypothetical protein [Streptosporangium album]
MAIYRGLDLMVGPTDSEHHGYFEAARQHKLVVQRCRGCGLLRGTIGAACPYCSALAWEWEQVSGKGVIYSYAIVAQAVHPAFRDAVPYPLVLVELDEQRAVPWRDGAEGELVSVRKIANLVRADDVTQPEDEKNVAIGMRVEVCFVDLDDDMALPQFRLTGEPPEHSPWRAD